VPALNGVTRPPLFDVRLDLPANRDILEFIRIATDPGPVEYSVQLQGAVEGRFPARREGDPARFDDARVGLGPFVDLQKSRAEVWYHSPDDLTPGKWRDRPLLSLRNVKHVGNKDREETALRWFGPSVGRFSVVLTLFPYGGSEKETPRYLVFSVEPGKRALVLNDPDAFARLLATAGLSEHPILKNQGKQK
jgi:hypothetical protein